MEINPTEIGQHAAGASGCGLVREEAWSWAPGIGGSRRRRKASGPCTAQGRQRESTPVLQTAPLSNARTPKESFPQSGPGCIGSRECAVEIHNLKPFVRLNLIPCNSSSSHSKQPKPPYRSLFTVPRVAHSQKVENSLFKEEYIKHWLCQIACNVMDTFYLTQAS